MGNTNFKKRGKRGKISQIVCNKDIKRMTEVATELYKDKQDVLNVLAEEMNILMWEIGKKHPEMRLAANEFRNVVIALIGAKVRLEPPINRE